MNTMAATVDMSGMEVPSAASTEGRRSLASTISVALHALMIVAAISGVGSKFVPPQVPPDMVVEVVLEPPPPPKVAPPPEPPKVQPQTQTPPSPVVSKPVARVSAKPVPVATTPSPDAVAEPVSAAPPVAEAKPVPQSVQQPPQPAEVNPSYDPEVAKVYLSGIKELVQDKVVYPVLSLRRGEQGTVRVHTFLSRDGAVVDVAAAEDDGVSARLRDAAIKAVKDAAPYPHMPDTVPGNPVKVTIPVVFEIK